MRASATGAPSLSNVTSRTGSSALRADSASCSMACLRVYSVTGGCRADEFRAHGRGERPVDGATDGRRRGGAHAAHPQERRVAASASIAVRPVGPALFEISEKVSTRPLASVTMPASALVPVNEPGLGAQEARSRLARLGVEVAVGQGAAASGDRQQVDQRAQVGRRVARGRIDHPVERQGGQPVVRLRARWSRRSIAPVVSTPALAQLSEHRLHCAVETLGTIRAPRRLRGRSTRPSRCRSRSSSRAAASISGGDCTSAICLAVAGVVRSTVTVAGFTPRAAPARGPRRAPGCRTAASRR